MRNNDNFKDNTPRHSKIQTCHFERPTRHHECPMRYIANDPNKLGILFTVLPLLITVRSKIRMWFFSHNKSKSSSRQYPHFIPVI